MLKRLLLFVLSATVVAACGGGAKATAGAEDKVKAIPATWFERYNAGDADGLANLYAEDALVLPDSVPGVMGRAAFRSYIAADITKTKAAGVTFKHGGVTGAGVSGDEGWVSGTFLISDATGATVQTGKYLSVFHRANDAWLYIRDTWNSDTEPAIEEPVAADTHASSGSSKGVIGKTKSATKSTFSKIKGVFHR